MTTARSSPPDPSDPLVARIADLAVSVPLELSARLLDAVPAVAEKVPAAAGRVRREVVLARFIGKLAVDQGLRELRERLDPRPATPVGASTPETSPTSSAPATRATPVDSLEPIELDSDVAPVAADDLALADYDHLSSAQIVAKLSGLDPSELAEIGAYERNHRHRRTILGKIDQLGAT
jgi:hypothetical protein